MSEQKSKENSTVNQSIEDKERFEERFKEILRYQEQIAAQCVIQGIDAYAVPSWDEWGNEYVPDELQRLRLITGFSGSNGVAVITADRSAPHIFITDGRYITQAGQELDGNWLVLDMFDEERLRATLAAARVRQIGYDPLVANSRFLRLFSECSMNALSPNLIDLLDGYNEPLARLGVVKAPWVVDTKVAGQTAVMKLRAARQQLPAGVDYALCTDPAAISWLLNLRGNAVPYSGMILAYFILTREGQHRLYANFSLDADGTESVAAGDGSVSNAGDDHEARLWLTGAERVDASYFADCGVQLYPLTTLWQDIERLSDQGGAGAHARIAGAAARGGGRGFGVGSRGKAGRMILDYDSASIGLKMCVNKDKWHSPALDSAAGRQFFASLSQRKAIKSRDEIQGFVDAHVVDGMAVSRFLAWLKGLVNSDGIATETLDELQAVDRLLEERRQVGGGSFSGLSFCTIMGYGANGAVIHYKPQSSTNQVIMRQGEAVATGGLLLLDSGAHYYTTAPMALGQQWQGGGDAAVLLPNGSTDVTRTVAIGQPTAEQICRFTAVLRGHIAVARLRFPSGTTGQQLDAIARQYLWQLGADYQHGTGHGVGHILSVHEGPQSLGKHGRVPLEVGMVVSIEPGYYAVGRYGIRCENLYVVEQAAGLSDFMQFRWLTLVPFDWSLIDQEELSKEELAWLHAYEAAVAAMMEIGEEGQ